MKVTYEFNDEDREDRKFFEHSSDMYLALSNISDYIQSLKKKEIKEDLDDVIENVFEFIYKSKIDEI